MSWFRFFFGNPLPALDAAEVHRRARGQPPPLLLDVRQGSEYRRVRIAGSMLIPLPELNHRVGELPNGREIIRLCASGHRSGPAARMLTAQGYSVCELSGGLSAWMQAGLPVERGD